MSAKRSNTMIMDLNEIYINLEEDNTLTGLLASGVRHMSDVEQHCSSQNSNKSQSSEADYEYLESSGDTLSECFANVNINAVQDFVLPSHKEPSEYNINDYSDNFKKRISKGFKKNAKNNGKNTENLKNLCTPQESTISSLDDLVGLDDVKQKLREALLFPMKYPHLFQGSGPRTAWSSALLFGPPGVGKTALINGIASEAKLPLYCLSSSDLMSSYFGETEKKIRAILGELKKERCVVFIDEIDAICRRRGGQDSESGRRMQSELLLRLDNNEDSRMFLVCATNCPWDIDPAFLRRFQQQIYVPLPDWKAREGLFLKYLNMGRIPRGWKNWIKLINDTDGMTGSDIKMIVRSASMIPIKEMHAAQCWEMCEDGRCIPSKPNKPNTITCAIENLPSNKVWCRQTTVEDLTEAMSKHIRTVTEKTFEPYENYLKEHCIS